MNAKITISHLLSGVTIVLASSVDGATSFGYDFSSQSPGDFFTGDVGGWTQSRPNNSFFGQTQAFSYIASTNFGAGLQNTGHLGSQFANTVDGSSTTITGALDTDGSVPIRGRLIMKLAIIDEIADQFTDRDAFSFAIFNDSSSNVAQIDFTPTLGDNLSWGILVGVNGGPALTTIATLDVKTGYQFQIDFQSVATIFSYGSSQSGLADNVIAALGPVAPADIKEVQLTHNPLGIVGNSATTLVFDDIIFVFDDKQDIPEPSSNLLGLLALPFLLGKRRR